MQDIEACTTPQAGFHSFICDSRGFTEVAYNSCSNRHCPNCQWMKQEIWNGFQPLPMLPERTHEKVKTTGLLTKKVLQFFIKQVCRNNMSVCKKNCRQKFCK